MIDRRTIISYRLAVNHLVGSRLDRSEIVTVAHGGLQDGSPRSGLLSMAARIEGVTPDDWRHPSLAQVFGPRGAIYLVPKEDVDIWTRGLLPRDPQHVARLNALADRVVETLDGRTMRQADLLAALPGTTSRELRGAAAFGSFDPVWDTVDTLVEPRTPRPIDPELARHELARRYFRYHGPATTADLQWWLDGSRSDAKATVAELAGELEEVQTAHGPAFIPRDTRHLLTGFSKSRPLLLPPDDTYLNRRSKDLLVPDPKRRTLLWPQAPPPGALVDIGEVLGTFRRRQGQIEITPWVPIPRNLEATVDEIIADLPLGPATGITWLDPIQ